MNPTRIEWADWSSNPVPGYCPIACPFCYARAMYDRFRWDKTIRFIPEELLRWSKAKPGDKVFVGSTIELFGPRILNRWIGTILEHVTLHPLVTFQFLSKKPEKLSQWNPWPENCWVGVTATDLRSGIRAVRYLQEVDASVRFISIEPLLGRMKFLNLDAIDWLILGGLSGPERFYPPAHWIQEIEKAADEVGIPVFEKNNLRQVWHQPPRREWPK